MRSAFFVGLLVAGAVPVAAFACEGEAIPAARPAKPAKEKKICRRIEGQVMSRISERVCKTAQQWEDADSASSLTDSQRAGGR